MNQLTDIAAKIEALPEDAILCVVPHEIRFAQADDLRGFDVDVPEIPHYPDVDVNDLKAIAAEVKRLTEENTSITNALEFLGVECIDGDIRIQMSKKAKWARAQLAFDTLQIERLESEVKRLTEENARLCGYDHAAAELRWIPVSERLPENGKAHYLTIEEDGKRSVIKGFWHQRSGRWCGITETTEVGYKLPVTQTVIAWQIIPEKIIIEPYAEPADNIGEGV